MKRIFLCFAIAVVAASCGDDRANTGNGGVDSTARKVDATKVAADDSSVSEEHLDSSKKIHIDSINKH